MFEDELEEFERLLLDWEDETLDDLGIARAREILRTLPEARTRYVELQVLRAALHLDGEAQIASFELPPEIKPGKVDVKRVESRWRRYHWGSWMAVCAASLLVCLSVGRWLMVESRLKTALQSRNEVTVVDKPQRIEATSAGIAYITRLVDVRWGGRGGSAVGDALSPGLVQIESGFAQIEFFCGATVVLEGPAQLDLESANSARLIAGRLRAQVPPAARGFQIHADEMKIVDLGTEFGVAVTPQAAGVQVFDGEIELHQLNDPPRLVKAGNAVVRENKGELSDVELTPSNFVDLETLERHAQDQTVDRYQRWLRFSSELREDPRLIVYYSMDQGSRWTRKLPSTLIPANRELDGAIVGAKRVVGRWPQKSAIEFKRPGDRVRVDIPGEYESLTFACWVKIDSLDRWYNSLFLTDNYQRGEPHWQILETGQLHFSVRVRQGNVGQEHREVLSPPFWNPSMSGRWIHLATTYSVEDRTTTHYLNGEILSREVIPEVQIVRQTRIGKASIGNWSLPTRPDAEFAIRNLNGTIDEFALFGAALNSKEIQDLYHHGRP